MHPITMVFVIVCVWQSERVGGLPVAVRLNIINAAVPQIKRKVFVSFVMLLKSVKGGGPGARRHSLYVEVVLG